jgi:hypothetical protein
MAECTQKHAHTYTCTDMYAGYTRQVMVMYNGVHYDALAVAPSPRSPADDDTTEFNPRSRRGRLIIAAARKLVALHRKGRPGHAQAEADAAEAARKARAARKSAGGAGGSTGGAAPAGQNALALSCSDCGEKLEGAAAAAAHAAKTGHTNFEEVRQSLPGDVDGGGGGGASTATAAAAAAAAS